MADKISCQFFHVYSMLSIVLVNMVDRNSIQARLSCCGTLLPSHDFNLHCSLEDHYASQDDWGRLSTAV